MHCIESISVRQPKLEKPLNERRRLKVVDGLIGELSQALGDWLEYQELLKDPILGNASTEPGQSKVCVPTEQYFYRITIDKRDFGGNKRRLFVVSRRHLDSNGDEDEDPNHGVAGFTLEHQSAYLEPDRLPLLRPGFFPFQLARGSFDFQTQPLLPGTPKYEPNTRSAEAAMRQHFPEFFNPSTHQSPGGIPV